MKKIINVLYYISGGLLFITLFAFIVSIILKMLNFVNFFDVVKLFIIFVLHLVFIQIPLLLIIHYLEKKYSNGEENK